MLRDVGCHPRLRQAGVACALVASLAAGTVPVLGQTATGCGTLQACRAAALAAEAAGDGERFHDLAWQVTRLAPRDDPAVMYLVARAQAASGRSSDALVMLRRLAEAGVATDAAELEVFERVRERDGWPAVEALAGAAARRIAREAVAPVPTVASSTSTSTATLPPTPIPSSSGAGEASAVPPAESAPGSPVASPAAPAYGRAFTADVAMRLDAEFDSVSGGFAYDAVSGRYLVGDRDARKIVVVDEPSRRVADLVRGDSAGFRQLVAMEIDTRRGDLWVLSNDEASASGGAGATLHKLQLIAGRPLGRIEAPADAGTVRFTDLAVAADGAVLVVDADGRRLYRVAPRGTTLEPLMTLDLPAPEAITMADGDSVAYVAHADGVSRVDIGRRRVEPVRVAAAAAGVPITGVWWHDGALVVLRAEAAGDRTLQRWQLDRKGTAVTEIRQVEMTLPDAPMPIAVTLSGSTLLVLTRDPQAAAASGAADTAPARIVRRVRLGP